MGYLVNAICEYWVSKVRRAQSSLSIFAQKYLHKCEDTYFILQNKYICIDEDSFGVKILGDDCIQSTSSTEILSDPRKVHIYVRHDINSY